MPPGHRPPLKKPLCVRPTTGLDPGGDTPAQDPEEEDLPPRAAAGSAPLQSADRTGLGAEADRRAESAPAEVPARAPADKAPELPARRPGAPAVPNQYEEMSLADATLMGGEPPGVEERRWIEVAIRRMFRSLEPEVLDNITRCFREWRLPPSVAIFRQAAPISTGPGLCVLFEGVVDVLTCPKGTTEHEKVCTYDRCGQCFGELELFYDAPRAAGASRKVHWATIATRTAVILWTADRAALRGSVPGSKSYIAPRGAAIPPLPTRQCPEVTRRSDSAMDLMCVCERNKQQSAPAWQQYLPSRQRERRERV